MKINAKDIIGPTAVLVVIAAAFTALVEKAKAAL